MARGRVATGPVPKRTSERRRRNKPVIPVDTVTLDETVTIPELGMEVHPLASDLYESLTRSGQAQYYEPCDWQRARIAVHVLDHILTCGKFPAILYQAFQRDLDALLVSEAERRRVRMEVERGKSDDSEAQAKVARMAEYRRAAER